MKWNDAIPTMITKGPTPSQKMNAVVGARQAPHSGESFGDSGQEDDGQDGVIHGSPAAEDVSCAIDHCGYVKDESQQRHQPERARQVCPSPSGRHGHVDDEVLVAAGLYARYKQLLLETYYRTVLQMMGRETGLPRLAQ